MKNQANKEPGEFRLRKVSRTFRLSPVVVARLERCAAENGVTLTDEVEARLIETLTGDGIITADQINRSSGVYAQTSAALS